MHLRRGYSQAVCAVAVVVAGVVMAGPVSGAGAASRAPAASDTWPMFAESAALRGFARHRHWGVDGTGPDHEVVETAEQRARSALAGRCLQRHPGRNARLRGDTRRGRVRVQCLDGGAGLAADKRPNATSSPAVYRNTVYFGDNGGTLYALNAATGAVQCTFTLPVSPPATTPGRIIGSPVVGNVDGTGPTVFFGDAGDDSPGETLNGGHVWAVTGVGNTAGECKEKWVYNNWQNKGTNGSMTGVWDGAGLVKETNGTWAVVFGTSNPDNAVYALNAANGSSLWRFQTVQSGDDQDVGARPTISAPGINGFADGVVYIDGKDGVEYALDLLTGQSIWSFTLGPGSADAIAVSTAALAGDTLVAAYSGSMFAINATTGTMIWHAAPGGRFEASPAVSGGAGDQALFAGNTNGHEYGLSLANGAVLFNATGAARIQDSTAVADGTLYFASGGTLYAYAPAG